jgi:hypothetical protein
MKRIFLIAIAVVIGSASASGYNLASNALRGTAPDGSPVALQVEDNPLGVMVLLLRLDRDVNQWLGLWYSTETIERGFQTAVDAAGGANAFLRAQAPKINRALLTKWPAGSAAVVPGAADPPAAASTHNSTPAGVMKEAAERFTFRVDPVAGTVSFSPK